MKKIIVLLVVLLGSSCLYSQIGRVEFVDGTIGYAIDPKLSKYRFGDMLTFESLDQKVWRIAQMESDSLLTVKKGVLQKVAVPGKDIFAKVRYANEKKNELVDDFALSLFSVGDTIQIVKRLDSYGEDIYRIYWGQLPDKESEENQSVVITKIKQW
jgi:hypothetical protein